MKEQAEQSARLLVVDDEEGFRELLNRILQKEGYKVDTAPSGEEAIRAARTHSYDLIFLDLNMPGMGGMQVLKTLKPESPTTDFIIITAYADVHTAVELMKLGAWEYITKPVEPSEFIQHVRTALRAHNAELRVREIQSEFSSRLLHDLRGPLVVVNSNIDLLAHGSLGRLTREQQQILDEIKRQMNKMDALLNDMTDLTLFESGKVHIETLPLNLDVLVPRICDRMNAQAKAKNITLIMKIGDNIPTLELDPEKIQQVFHNLVDNGIKYTREGGSITIGLALCQHVFNGTQRDSVEITVSDTGVGIPNDELPLVFDKYKTILTGRTSTQKTTGLGLAICRSIVEAHQGQMTAESVVGKGTTFRIFLPADDE